MTNYAIPWDRTFDKNKKYVWISETGKNTCEECKSLDGMIFSGDNVPLRPHLNCKCQVEEQGSKEFENIKYINNQIQTVYKYLDKCSKIHSQINSIKNEEAKKDAKTLDANISNIETSLNSIHTELNN